MIINETFIHVAARSFLLLLYYIFDTLVTSEMLCTFIKNVVTEYIGGETYASLIMFTFIIQTKPKEH